MQSDRDSNKNLPDKKWGELVHVSVPVNVNFAGGLLTGFFISICFHPLDRALYLKNTDKTFHPLFAPKYWKKPFSGLRTTVYQRMLSASLYFTMQGELNSQLKPAMQENQYPLFFIQLTIGVLTGITTGLFSNANHAVKYYSYKHGKGKKPLENAIKMWQKGGISPFFKGVTASVMRDSIFGINYELINYATDTYLLNELNKKIEDEKLQGSAFFISRFLSATTATACSSPFNYIRSMQFNSKLDKKQPHSFDILCDAWKESNKYIKEHPEKFFARMNFFQSRFMIGSGTARSGLGMASGQLLMNTLKPAIQNLDGEAKKSGNRS
jgi:hypothetical protein